MNRFHHRVTQSLTEFKFLVHRMFKRKIFSVRLCVTLWCPPQKNGIIMNITIRPTRLEELGQVMPFYERARRFMAANGNANQWINGYPSPPGRRSQLQSHQRRRLAQRCPLRGDPSHRIRRTGKGIDGLMPGMVFVPLSEPACRHSP